MHQACYGLAHRLIVVDDTDRQISWLDTQLRLRLGGTRHVLPFPFGQRPRDAAIGTRLAIDGASILRITRPRCAFTVISLMPSSPAICLFSKPKATNAITSRWRPLSEAYRS